MAAKTEREVLDSDGLPIEVGSNVITTGYGWGITKTVSSSVGVVQKIGPKRIAVLFPGGEGIKYAYPEQLRRWNGKKRSSWA